MAKKWMTKDEALTRATGMNQEQRDQWNQKLDELFDKKSSLKEGSQARKVVEAEIMNHMWSRR